MQFQDLPLRPETLAALEKKGFKEATPIQAQTIPLLMDGRDVIGQAQTGTGKTAAFGLPVMEAAYDGHKSLILAPTRELAKQVQRELQDYGPAHVSCLIGGTPIPENLRELKRDPLVIVATPGRVVDLIDRGALTLDEIAIFVLDEADEMLSMGFQDELDAIVDKLPPKRQNVLFTATLAKNVERLAKKTLTNPETVRIGKTTSSNLDQCFAVVAGKDRIDAYRRIMEVEQPQAALLFARTRARVDELTEGLRAINAESLHGGMGQAQRDAVMQRFRKGTTSLLIATDVAARGLDIDEVELVMHDEPAGDTDTYVHRIGRTARAGRSGRSIVFVAPGKTRRLAPLKNLTDGKLSQYQVPSDEDLARLRIRRVLDDLKAITPDLGQWAMERALKEGFTVEELAAKAMQYILEVPEQEEPDEGEMTAMAIKVGKIDDVNPGAIVATLVNAGGLRADDIGRIDILPRMSVVEVPVSQVPSLID
ncbi:MAG: DEAD/DEAH box helicase, partial [Thermoplasmatota archaeon]